MAIIFKVPNISFINNHFIIIPILRGIPIQLYIPKYIPTLQYEVITLINNNIYYSKYYINIFLYIKFLFLSDYLINRC